MYRIVLLRAKVNNTWKHEGRGCIDSRLHICCFGSVNEAAGLVLGGVLHAHVCVAGPTQQVVFVCTELFDILLLWPPHSKCGTWKRKSDAKRNVYAAICTQAEAETNVSYLQLQRGEI